MADEDNQGPPEGKTPGDPIMTAMMAELGNDRLEELPLDDVPQSHTRGRRDEARDSVDFHTPTDRSGDLHLDQQVIPARPAPSPFGHSLGQHWKIAINSGAFNDEDREATFGLRNLGGARLYSNNPIGSTHESRMGRDMAFQSLTAGHNAPGSRNGPHAHHAYPVHPGPFGPPVSREVPADRRGHHIPAQASALGIVRQSDGVPTRFFPPRYASTVSTAASPYLGVPGNGTPMSPANTLPRVQGSQVRPQANSTGVTNGQLEMKQQLADVIYEASAKLKGEGLSLQPARVVLCVESPPAMGRFYLYVMKNLFADWSLDRYGNYRNRANDVQILFRKHDGTSVIYHLIFENEQAMMKLIFTIQELRSGKHSRGVPTSPSASRASPEPASKAPSAKTVAAVQTRVAETQPKSRGQNDQSRPKDAIATSQQPPEKDPGSGSQQNNLRGAKTSHAGTATDGVGNSERDPFSPANVSTDVTTPVPASQTASLMDANEEDLARALSDNTGSQPTAGPALIDLGCGETLIDVGNAPEPQQPSATEDLKDIELYWFNSAPATRKQILTDKASQLLSQFREHLGPDATMQQFERFAQGVIEGVAAAWYHEQSDFQPLTAEDKKEVLDMVIQDVFDSVNESASDSSSTLVASSSVTSNNRPTRIVLSRDELLALRPFAINPPHWLAELRFLPQFNPSRATRTTRATRNTPSPQAVKTSPGQPSQQVTQQGAQKATVEQAAQVPASLSEGNTNLVNVQKTSSSALGSPTAKEIVGLKKSKWADGAVDLTAEAKFTGPKYEFPISNMWILAKLGRDASSNSSPSKIPATDGVEYSIPTQPAKEPSKPVLANENKQHTAAQPSVPVSSQSDISIRTLIEKVASLSITDAPQTPVKKASVQYIVQQSESQPPGQKTAAQLSAKQAPGQVGIQKTAAAGPIAQRSETRPPTQDGVIQRPVEQTAVRSVRPSEAQSPAQEHGVQSPAEKILLRPHQQKILAPPVQPSEAQLSVPKGVVELEPLAEQAQLKTRLQDAAEHSAMSQLGVWPPPVTPSHAKPHTQDTAVRSVSMPESETKSPSQKTPLRPALKQPDSATGQKAKSTTDQAQRRVRFSLPPSRGLGASRHAA